MDRKGACTGPENFFLSLTLVPLMNHCYVNTVVKTLRLETP